MYHSIYFGLPGETGTTNTWDDWRMIPTAKPVIPPPQLVTKYVEIPGRSGAIDLSSALGGIPYFKTRSGSWDFVIPEDYYDSETGKIVPTGNPNDIFYRLLNTLHGKRVKIVLEDDITYYYEGRITIDGFDFKTYPATVKIGYQVDTFKKAIEMYSEDWLWDTFSFIDGVINITSYTVVSGTPRAATIALPNDISINVVPIIRFTPQQAANTMSITFENHTYPLVSGSNRNPDIQFKPGDNSITLTGNGTVSIDFRGVAL